jgi:hypothetical protein
LSEGYRTAKQGPVIDRQKSIMRSRDDIHTVRRSETADRPVRARLNNGSITRCCVYGDQPEHHASHETIYTAIYARLPHAERQDQVRTFVSSMKTSPSAGRPSEFATKLRAENFVGIRRCGT